MECFIKKVWENKGDMHGQTHEQFVRFSKGKFENRALLNLQKSNGIKIRGSFEWANDFVTLVSEISDAKFSGKILSKQQLNIEAEKKKSGILVYEVSNITNEKIKEISDKVYYMLLDAQGEGIDLKIKKKLPKPGKSGEAKTDDKFCQLEVELKYWTNIQEAFMFPECKKCKISHTYIIEQLILPEGEKDFAKIRETAKRKGKIIRKLEVDKKESKEEREFEV